MIETKSQSADKPTWRSPFGIALLIAIGIIFFFLWSEHRAHLLGALPLLLLLAACPLMHLFMHRCHRSGHQRGSGKGDKDSEQGGPP